MFKKLPKDLPLVQLFFQEDQQWFKKFWKVQPKYKKLYNVKFKFKFIYFIVKKATFKKLTLTIFRTHFYMWHYSTYCDNILSVYRAASKSWSKYTTFDKVQLPGAGRNIQFEPHLSPLQELWLQIFCASIFWGKFHAPDILPIPFCY